MYDSWFRTRREELEMSQGDVAREFIKRGVDLTAGAVSGWDRGQIPSVDYVDCLAAVYRVPAAKILSVMHEMGRARVAAKEVTSGK